MNEDRLIDIEIKISRQEDLLETLNQMVYRQQTRIDELETLCAALARRIKEMSLSDAGQGPGNERPPHY
jgi:SlyX protein